MACALPGRIAGAPADNWSRAVTPHFEVLTTAGGETAGEVGAYLERIQAFFASFLTLPPSTGTRSGSVFNHVMKMGSRANALAMPASGG